MAIRIASFFPEFPDKTNDASLIVSWLISSLTSTKNVILESALFKI
jgi:hypothetical protein